MSIDSIFSNRKQFVSQVKLLKTMGFDKKFVTSAQGIPFGRNVHAAIFSSIPETIGSYMRYRIISLHREIDSASSLKVKFAPYLTQKDKVWHLMFSSYNSWLSQIQNLNEPRLLTTFLKNLSTKIPIIQTSAEWWRNISCPFKINMD